ncbi:MAG: TolC family protein [Phycisphaeraceae bacterium]|nr:MAG: TolC family protein [Phycisphaeraceae bacterium]
MKTASTNVARARHASRCAAASKALFAGLLSSLAGCQSYEPKPLDLDATRSAWLSRSPEDSSVREFAAALDRVEGGSQAEGFDPSDGISLAEAEAVALVFNPDLRQARLEANVTRATAAHAGLWQDPVLGVDLERIVSGAGGGANPWVAGSTIGITIPISGRLEAEKARADAELAAELDRVAAKEWATRAALRELWVEWSAARVLAEVTQELITRLGEIASLADQQEKAGSMTRVDARLFRVELAGREADLIAATARVEELELQLKAMLGLAPDAATTLVPTLTFAARTTSADELVPLLDSCNPELAAVRAEYELSEQWLRAEVRKQYPDLTIGPGYGSDQGDDRVLLGLSLPIPLWNRNQQGIALASAEREVARGRFETTYERLSSRLAIALTRHEAGKAQRSLVESSVVPLADEQEADVRRVAALGRIDPLLLLESLKTQHAAKVRLVEARASESIAAVRLDELIGPPTPSIPPPAPQVPAPAAPTTTPNHSAAQR